MGQSALSPPSQVPARPLPRILKSALGNVAAVGTIAGAWGYLAGYVYTTEFLENFGLGFGVTTKSFAEIVVLGYYATLYAVWRGALWLGLVILVEFIAVALAAILIVYGARRDWPLFPSLLEATAKSADHVNRALLYFLSSCFLVLFLIGAAPAGSLAAQYDINVFARRAHLGCCKQYQLRGNVFRATILTADTNTTWLLMRDKVVAVETKTLRVIAPRLSAAQTKAHVLPWQPIK